LDNIDHFFYSVKLVPWSTAHYKCLYPEIERNDGSESTILKIIDLMKHFVKSRQGRVYNLINNRSYKTGPKVDEHFKTNLKLPFHN
jgi:hypothetical protein